MTVVDLMESIKDVAKEKVKEWWDSGQTLMTRGQSWRDSASEKLHPCLRYPLLALIDAAYWCMVGIGLLAMLVFGLFFFCSFMLLMMAPFLMVASWLSAYLLPPVDRAFHPSLYLRHTIFAWASIVLYGILYVLNNSVKKTNPDQNLTDFLTTYIDGLALIPWIAVTYALWIVISACCVVFTYDFTLAVGWGFFAVSFFLYHFFFFCYLLIRHIPWYVLLPLAIFLPLFVISLFHRVSSGPSSDPDCDDDNDDQRYDPPESMYGDVQSCVMP